MDHQSLVEFLKRNQACALQWLGDRDLAKAWEQCHRGDWMLWLAATAGIDRRRLVMAACACARLALVHVSRKENRSRLAIETTEAWCRGEATIEQVKEVRGKACVVAAAAAAAAAVDSGIDAVRAAGVAAAAAVAAAEDAESHSEVAVAAARQEMQRKTASIVRSMITVEEVEGAIQAQELER